MIIITGGAGFIGSALLKGLNDDGIYDIILTDRLGKSPKWKNLVGCHFDEFIHKDQFINWLKFNQKPIDAVIHMGACSSTTELDADYLMSNNTNFSKSIFRFCQDTSTPLIYASSAATYGTGGEVFSDDHDIATNLKPGNMYGFSKHCFDLWCLSQGRQKFPWYGLKFFNVFGPGEYHKGAQASVVFHAFNQINETGRLKLFKSYKEPYAHGEQMRDFVYVKDVVSVVKFLLNQKEQKASGLYNVGTGKARTFLDLGKATFTALGHEAAIDWIEMPETIRHSYQYYTEASMGKLRNLGYDKPFASLEDSINDYVQNHLKEL